LEHFVVISKCVKMLQSLVMIGQSTSKISQQRKTERIKKHQIQKNGQLGSVPGGHNK